MGRLEKGSFREGLFGMIGGVTDFAAMSLIR